MAPAMALYLIFAINLFAFLAFLMATLGNYFQKRWAWFWAMLICVLASGACMFAELYQWLGPPPLHDMPLIIRQPINPL
jgi:hypothetical protein